MFPTILHNILTKFNNSNSILRSFSKVETKRDIFCRLERKKEKDPFASSERIEILMRLTNISISIFRNI